MKSVFKHSTHDDWRFSRQLNKQKHGKYLTISFVQEVAQRPENRFTRPGDLVAMQRRIQLGCVNPYLTCTLCSGYLVDATTIVECLHSFCRSCILKHLEVSYNCPKCSTEIHKTKPLEYIRSDPCLQEIVYKLVPDLYSKEETRKSDWQKSNETATDLPGPSVAISDDPEDVRILVTLKYFRGTSRMERIKTEHVLQMFPTRYLCCQPEMPVRVLKKFVQYKFDISPDVFQLDLWRGDETLIDDLTLKQLVQIYGLFRERKPLELHYSFYPKFTPTPKEIPSTPSILNSTHLPTQSLLNAHSNMDLDKKPDDGIHLLENQHTELKEAAEHEKPDGDNEHAEPDEESNTNNTHRDIETNQNVPGDFPHTSSELSYTSSEIDKHSTTSASTKDDLINEENKDNKTLGTLDENLMDET